MAGRVKAGNRFASFCSSPNRTSPFPYKALYIISGKFCRTEGPVGQFYFSVLIMSMPLTTISKWGFMPSPTKEKNSDQTRQSDRQKYGPNLFKVPRYVRGTDVPNMADSLFYVHRLHISIWTQENLWTSDNTSLSKVGHFSVCPCSRSELIHSPNLPSLLGL